MRMTSAPICAIVMPPSGAATKAETSTIRRSWSRRFIQPSCRAPANAARPSRSEPSGAGDERAQGARLVFDLVEPALDDVADADDAAEAPVLDDREMPDAPVCHLGHQLIDRLTRVAGHYSTRHHLGDLERKQISAVIGEAVDNVAFRYDAIDALTVPTDNEGADVPRNQHVHGGGDR